MTLADLQQQVAEQQKTLVEKDSELNIVQQELDQQKEENSRAPTTTMKNLVERLKHQLALKEKQHKVSTGNWVCTLCIVEGEGVGWVVRATLTPP